MALKAKIDKATYDALPDAVKAEYKADGEGFKLDIDDTEIAAEMRRARDREKQRADAAEAARAEADRKLVEMEGNDARKRGDIDSIERSWKEKLDKAIADSAASVGTLKSQLEAVTIDAAITSMAAEIFVNPKRDARLIRDRVYVDYDGEKPIVRVRDAEGKASSMSLDDLKKETLDNKDYADILIGSKATGSGGAGGNQGGGAPKQPSDYTEAQRVELFKTNPAEFRRLFPTTA